MNPLRREQMRVDLEVGLYEGGAGQRLHGTIERLDRQRVHVWVHDPHYSTALPLKLRGYLTALSYREAEGGAMWAEPDLPPALGRATGNDLLAFLRGVQGAGLVGVQAARVYRVAVRRVLAQHPEGTGAEITGDPAETVARFTAACSGALAESTVTQYASGYRRAREIYLAHLAASTDTRVQIPLGHGRHITLSEPADLTEGDRRTALDGLTARWTPPTDATPGGAS